MTKENWNRGEDFIRHIEEMPREELNQHNEDELRRYEEEHQRFHEAFENEMCYLCNKSLDSFSKKAPCLHWLLKPKGFKKKNLPAVADQYGMRQLETYLRWVANLEKSAKNINDIQSASTGGKLVELTIKYKHLEWSFSCAESDFNGHHKSMHSDFPHYHFQMRVGRMPFINYSDFHLSLSGPDILSISATKANPEVFLGGHMEDAGMAEMFSEDVIDAVLNSPTMKEQEDGGAFSIDTMLCAKDGGTIKGEDVYKIIQKAKENGVSIASLAHEVPNAEVEVSVSPGAGVVEQAPRTGTSRAKKR